jgi:hypothetical protein
MFFCELRVVVVFREEQLLENQLGILQFFLLRFPKRALAYDGFLVSVVPAALRFLAFP